MSEIDDIIALMETENREEEEILDEETVKPVTKQKTPKRFNGVVPKKGTKEYETYRRKCMNGTIKKNGRPFDPEVVKREKEKRRQKYIVDYYRKYRAKKRKEFLALRKEQIRLEKEAGIYQAPVKKKRKRRPKEFLPYESAKDIVQFEGIRSSVQYNTWYKFNKPGTLPSHPPDHYGKLGQWKSWGDFLGVVNTYPVNEKIDWRPYNECLAYAQSLGNVNTMAEWIAYGKEGKHPPDVPTRPDIVYRKYGNLWISWNVFLRKKGQISAMQYVISKNDAILYIMKIDDPTNNKVYKIGVTVGGISSIKDAIKKFDLEFIEGFKVDKDFDWKQFLSKYASPHWDAAGVYEVPNIHELNLALTHHGVRIDRSELE